MDTPRYPRPRRRGHPVLWAFLLAAVILAGWFLWHFWVAMAPPPTADAQRPRKTVTLYFAAADGSGLVAEAREISDCLVEDDCLRSILQALMDGPAGNLAPVFPKQTTLHGITIDGDGVVQVDFGKNLVDNHPGGSWGELLTVHALADTLATNFPHLRQVRILIDGAGVETLKGHVDLRQPISPDFTLVNKVPAVEPPVAPAGRSQ